MRAITKQSRRSKQNYLSAEEIQVANYKIIKCVQNVEFSDDIKNLQTHKCVKQKSKIFNMNPFLDKDNMLRVGGRLKNSNISEKMKHPLIIPHSSHFTDILIDHAHKQTFHGGARVTLSWLRQEYWIVGGNRAVKKRLQQCVICKRHNPVMQHQLMGDLPAARTNPTKPFHHTGVDFTGFIEVKSSKGRRVKTSKGYVSVFVCMVTKAIHLELVSDLSSSAFLAALRRFSVRRGTPRHIYCDNGTNFVGANKRLSQELIQLKSLLSNEFLTEVNEMKIEFHFLAPSWPSAGGLWESGVKSLKYHLRRVVGEQKLTFEEFTTLLSQLEACLNSRPLCALTEDTDDIDYLTPSHFLASGPVLTIYETEKDERTRWQLTQKIFQDIWKRWRAEYLTQLLARSLGSLPGVNIPEGSRPERPYFDDVSPRNVTSVVGQVAVLRCRAKHIGNRTVSWMRKRDLHILTSHIFTYTGDARFSVLHPEPSDDWDLKIDYVQPRDAGVYECQINTEPKINMAVILSVEDESHTPATSASPRSSAAAASIWGSQDVYVKKGSTISLTCSVNVHSSPPSSASVLWYHGTAVVDFDSPRGGISLETEKTEGGTTSKLLVTKASLTDSGNYTCVPSNAHPASVSVHVLNGEHPAAMQTSNRASSYLTSQISCAFVTYLVSSMVCR